MRIEIVTECKHGEWVGPHCTMEREGRCPYYPTDTDRECYCPGGSRRVLEPGSFVLVEKVNGQWPPVPCVRCGGSGFILEDRPGFVAEKLGCFDCDGDGVAPRNVVKAILDALAEGEQ